LERVRKINSLVAMMTEEMREQSHLTHVDVLVISPSQPLEKIAEKFADELPWTIRLLLRLVGANKHNGSILLSYLLSEKKFCRSLINLGYQDALKRRKEIQAFLELHGHSDLPQ